MNTAMIALAVLLPVAAVLILLLGVLYCRHARASKSAPNKGYEKQGVLQFRTNQNALASLSPVSDDGKVQPHLMRRAFRALAAKGPTDTAETSANLDAATAREAAPPPSPDGTAARAADANAAPARATRAGKVDRAASHMPAAQAQIAPDAAAQAGGGDAPVRAAAAGGEVAGGDTLQKQLRKVLRAADELTPVLIQAEIGRGAFGIVYRGTWKNIPVAVKTMLITPKGGSLENNPGLREATLALQLVHPNLVATYRANARLLEGTDASGVKLKKGLPASCQLFILQEYCDAGTMYDWLASLKLHPNGVTDKAVIARCSLDIARGIAHLHAANIVHGDLKPQNVMLSSTSAVPTGSSGAATPAPKNFPYNAKLTDFGLSFHIGHNRTHMSNMRVGTPFYYAPEVQDKGHLSTAADVYSFGVLLWEMFHGMPPYIYCDTKKKLVNNRSFPRFDLRPREEAPFSFVVLALACLNTDYSQRPAIGDVVTVLEDLNECLNGSPDQSSIMRNAPLKRLIKGSYMQGFAAPASLIKQSNAVKAPPAAAPAAPAKGSASFVLLEMIKSSGLTRDRDLKKRLEQTGAEELIRIAGLQPTDQAAQRHAKQLKAAATLAPHLPKWKPDIQLIPKELHGAAEQAGVNVVGVVEQRSPEEDGLRNAYTQTLKVINAGRL